MSEPDHRTSTPGEPLDPEQRISELRERHQALDLRLQQLDGQISLTPEEQVERKQVQKLKLLCKDQIAILQHAAEKKA
ncbi:MAG: DUF465 domain-containing protein [Myxococcota bacterium]|jgi:uncharacterized protein YdcH (DUF465 family)|nr:DUF465 domain-containing protein [Myxococcota bacterium]